MRFSKKELKEILKEGAGWLVKRGFGYPEDVGFIESEGRLPWANPDKVSERAFERGAPRSALWGAGTTSWRCSTWTRSTMRRRP